MAVIPGLLLHGQESRDTSALRSVQLKPMSIVEIRLKPDLRYHDLHSDQLRQFDYWMEESSLLSTQKRGGFAFEPILRGQGGGRMNVVLDGIRITGACTDHMDPITSYIEPANFQSMDIQSGGGELSGSGTAGSINLRTRNPLINKNKLSVEGGSEYRSVANSHFSFARTELSARKTGISASFTHRTQDSYRDGNANLVNYTQFSKYNFHFNVNHRVGKNHILSLKYLGDRGRDIGYPGLLMDVSRADANIIGLKWHVFKLNSLIRSAKIGLYYSGVYHEMDDTKRPPEEVAMHMDMPGWSRNLGSTIDLNFKTQKKISLKSQSEIYRRYSRAEMTMYPEGEGQMFLFTWPDIVRQVARTAVSFKKNFVLSELALNANLEFHKVFMDTILGYQQFSGFGAQLDSSSQYLPYSLDLSYMYKLGKRTSIFAELGTASRAPSRSELFGFYLFNAEDGFDYLGNPELKSEQVIRSEIGYSYAASTHVLRATAFYSHYFNFIFGEFDGELSGATPGTRGLKRYTNFQAANYSGADLNYQWNHSSFFSMRSSVSYLYASKKDGSPLPQIAPLELILNPQFKWRTLNLSPRLVMNGAQSRIDENFGEDISSEWWIADVAVFWEPETKKAVALRLKAEVTNIFDNYYWSHLDWRNIPRQGRSFNFALIIAFQKALKRPNGNEPIQPEYLQNPNQNDK